MNCKNCETLLSDSSKYCFECGGKVIHERLTLHHISSEFSAQFLNYDNKFLKTFVHLSTKPDVVIDGYIHGLRKKYINVIQYLAIALTLLGLQIFILNKFNPDYFIAGFDNNSMLEMYPEEDRLKIQEIQSSYLSILNEYQSLIYVVGIPLTAMVTKLVFLKEKLYNFTEHIVINTYITAQYVIFSFFIYLIFAIFNLNVGTLTGISVLIYVFYYCFVFYKTHKLRITTIILRFLLSLAIFLVIFFLLFIIATILIIIYVKIFK